MTNKNTKMIRIPSRGRVITSRGYINTPIIKPYRETLPNIFKMLTSKPKPTVLEVLPNGRTVELDLSNFDKDNTLIKPEISTGPVIPSVNNAETVPGEVVPGEATQTDISHVDPAAELSKDNSIEKVTTDEAIQAENVEVVPGEATQTDISHVDPAAELSKDNSIEKVTTDEAIQAENVEVVPGEATQTENVEVTPGEAVQTNNTNNNQSNRNKNKNKNKNRNNNDRHQASEKTNTENVEVVPEEVQ